MNLPNKITLSRILLMPAVIVIFLIDFDLNYFVAGLVFSLLCCTDFIDGALARKRGEVTTLGKFLDPLADKVAVAIGLFLLVYAGLFSYKDFHTTTFNIIGLVCSILIIIRELMIGLFRQVAISKGVSMSADMLGKVKTVITDFSIPVFPVITSPSML